MPKIYNQADATTEAAAQAVAMKDPEHLRRWILESRPFLVFRGEDLIDALPWPDGHTHLQQIIDCYRSHRRSLPTGDVETQIEPTLGKKIEVPVMKDEQLTHEEMDRCVRYFAAQLRTKDPSWSLESAAL